METLTTNDICVSVETFYQSDASQEAINKFLFAYQISIENKSDSTVQLMGRHWVVIDSNGEKKEVEGEGVVGEQPILEPGQSYQYISGCQLKTDIGKMHGEYFMKKIATGSNLIVKIPEFKLVAPFKLN